jgi:hypothetical protein
MFVQVKLIQRDRDLCLPEQFAQPAHGSGVLGAFLSVADEDLIQHGCRLVPISV